MSSADRGQRSTDDGDYPADMSASCDRCGATLAEGSRFCPDCGQRLSVAPRTQQTRKTVTILFSDLVDSTALGEALDAESLLEVMDRYFAAVSNVIERHGGVVEKFIGDAVMAVFGLPHMREDDALRGVRAAHEIRHVLTELNQELGLARDVRLTNRTGVNTGVVVGGSVNDRQRMATGDTVNIAARLEGAAPPGGIVLGPATLRLVRRFVAVTSIGPLRLKGKSETLAAYRLDGLVGDDDLGGQRPPPRQLVGRVAEMKQIEARQQASVDAATTESVLVLGDPGIGKSRLVKEAALRASARARVLTAACRPYGTTSFWPLTQLLRGVDPRDGPLDRSSLTAIASRTVAADREPIVDRVTSLLGLSDERFPLEECFWATSRLLQAVSQERPLVLLLEDLHWADDGLLDLLDRLRMAGQGAAMLILATARPEILERRWSQPGWHQEVIRLDPLSGEESDSLLDGLVGGLQLSSDLRDLVTTAAEGNPLFLEQVITAWVEEGTLVQEDAGWTLVRPVNQVRVPDTVAAIFAARLDRLPTRERVVLEAASVVGPVFVPAAIHAMSDSAPSGLDASLSRLVGAGYLHPLGDDPLPNRLAFTHASLRDVAYETTLKSERAALHERFADWRDSVAEESQRDESIGHHLAEAYRYRSELRLRDAHTKSLAVRALERFVAEIRRTMAIGDRFAADRLMQRGISVAGGMDTEVGLAHLDVLGDMAKLLVELGRWGDAVSVLTPYAGTRHGPLLRDLGVALCQLHRKQPSSPEYREGQRLLQAASTTSRPDVDAIASLAGTWKGVDDASAQALYRQCLDIDPSDPYALGNVIEYEISATGNLDVVDRLRDPLVQASKRCRTQADAGSNLPWAYFDAGKFALLLGDLDLALTCYAKAVQLASADHMVTTSLVSIRHIRSAVGDEMPGQDWVADFLTLARAARFPSPASLAELGPSESLPQLADHTGVVFVAGGTDATTDAWLETNEGALQDAFEGYTGLLVSGGTDSGVAGLVGSVRHHLGKSVTAIGYLPSVSDDEATEDARYDVLRKSSDREFNIGQPLRAWRDLIASGVRAGSVRMLAINGGAIAATEFRIGLALGCRVGVIVGSGREADQLLTDPEWMAAPNLVRLQLEGGGVHDFLSDEGAEDRDYGLGYAEHTAS